MNNGNGHEKEIVALEHVDSPNMLAPYLPTTLSGAREMAKLFAESKLVPFVQTEAKAFLIVATGAELGIPPTAALRSISVIDDRLALSAQLKIALCLRRKDICKYFKLTESTDEKATYETWRVGDEAPQRVTFTIEDARRMLGVARVNNVDGNWFKVRRRMLRWRAGSELADFMYPEITLGLPSTDELLDNIIDMKTPQPMQLDSNLAGVAAVVSEGAAAAKEERQEEKRQVANTIEPLEDAFTRWQAGLDAAATTAECDKTGAEMRKRLRKDTPEYERARKMVTDAKERLRTAHQKAEPPKPAEKPVPESPIDRDPGEEG